MKVFQINTVCGTGSTGRIAVDLYHVLEKAGHQCCIAYGRGQAPDGIDSYKIETTAGFYLHTAFSRLTDKEGLYSASATQKLIEKIKDYAPDIIHLHNIHGHYLNYPLLFHFLSAYDKPVVWTLHDCWALTGHCAYFDYIRCSRWKTGCEDCPQLRTYPISYLCDHSRENYALKKKLFTGVRRLHIVTPSQWLADLVKQSFLKMYDVSVIHNGIDVNVFKPTPSDFREKYHLQGKKIILGVASPWSSRKGLRDFIKLAKILNSTTVIVLVGINDKQLQSLPDNIIGLKRTSNAKELAEIYTAADVFFNPTYEDNYPTTNIESLACGTPVVTYQTGGSPECIQKNQGLVIKKGDFYNLLSFLSSSTAHDSLKMNEQTCANVDFDKFILFGDYVKLYKMQIQLARENING